MKAVTSLLALFTVVGFADAFFSAGKSRAVKSSPLADEAVAIFDQRYPFGRDPPKPNPFASVGMPDRDIDGTQYKKYQAGESTKNKRLTDISPEKARKNFNTLASLYGDEAALDMTKAFPLALALDDSKFAPCLDAFTENFGSEEAKAMVGRNPNLLAVSADEAAKSTDQTMVFSYIVGATRPAGPFLLTSLALLLLVPAFESATGIPIRTTALAAVTGSDPAQAAATINKIATPVWNWNK